MPTPTINASPASAQTAVTVLLTNDQAAFLDEVTAAIRRNTGGSVSRSAMLRAMMSALRPYYANWLKCRTEADVKEVIALQLRAGLQQHPQQACAQTATR